MNIKTTISRLGSQRNGNLLRWLLLLCLAFVANPCRADSSTLPEQLIGATQGFLEYTVEQYLATGQIEGRYEIEVRQLDPRMRMPLCDKELTSSLESARPIGRVTTRVRCEGSSPWTVFVPAQVKLYRNVVTAVRPLKRDAVITEEDVAMRERDVGLLGAGFLSSPDQAIGQKVLRSTVIDQILAPNFLEQPQMVRKGEQVVITARSGSIFVRMPGEALADGTFNEQIRVRNLNSKRVIKANITAPGQVEAPM